MAGLDAGLKRVLKTVMILVYEKNAGERPKAKALGYQPLVFAMFFAVAKALRSLRKSKNTDFFGSL